MNMDRITFLKKSLLGTLAAFAAVPLRAKQSEASTYDELMAPVGFNHLPVTEIKTMNTVLHKADTRGAADHGWLQSRHTFSFAGYYNPERVHFGVLRVLNDDVVAPGMGFGTHPHDNMEIISIPLEGDLEHKDSMGNVAVIKEGDVQVMSAGTGIRHSEYNRNKDKSVKFLQIWVFPRSKGVQPRYDQISLKDTHKRNVLRQILSPSPNDEGVWIHQDAWFHLGDFDKDVALSYALKKTGNGVYAFVLSGSFVLEGQELNARDGMGIWNTDKLQLRSNSPGRILLMEVPMTL